MGAVVYLPRGGNFNRKFRSRDNELCHVTVTSIQSKDNLVVDYEAIVQPPPETKQVNHVPS